MWPYDDQRVVRWELDRSCMGAGSTSAMTLLLLAGLPMVVLLLADKDDDSVEASREPSAHLVLQWPEPAIQRERDQYHPRFNIKP